ncbi:MAG TPA: cupredoxin domain-containing protein [Alphaproteobacteria bacterium]|nr:cupredoxin domain-containing protein [Alphaproteobacteria bacterium]
MDKIIKNVLIFGTLLLVIAAIAVVLAISGNNQSKSNQNNDINADTQTVYVGDAQQVKLSVQGGTYILSPSTLKKDVPVRMEVDMNTVKGCARSIVIPEFGVRQYVEPGNNVIEFTPTKTGTFDIACSMVMYTGTFTVE